MLTQLILVTTLAVVAAIVVAAIVYFRREDQTRALFAEAVVTGMDQVASLHPVIDPEKCIGSAACVDACPEQVLGVVDGKTYLVQANSCIGHGRCHDACPVSAISLVFGTAQRGVDLPLLRAGYESNVDGIYVIGELGGMGLIRNAMRQGAQVVETIHGTLAERLRPDPELLDVAIVGGGPAGIAAALHCVDRGIPYVLLEQYGLGGSVTHYPRRKLVFTEQIKLPIVGRFGKQEMLKDELIAEFERVVLQAGIDLREHRCVTAIKGRLGGFRLEVQGPERGEVYRARTIVLAIGRRGTPRRLEVPGEDAPHVVYRLSDPEQYRHRRVLVVGGGDSAAEAAVALSLVAGTEVHLSYRGDRLFRLKKNNREDLEAAVSDGRVTLYLETQVTAIGADAVELRGRDGGARSLAIDDVIVSVGGTLPTPFLEAMGVRVETKRGEKLDLGDRSERLAQQWASTFSRASARLSRSLASSRLPRESRGADDDPARPPAEADGGPRSGPQA